MSQYKSNMNIVLCEFWYILIGGQCSHPLTHSVGDPNDIVRHHQCIYKYSVASTI